MATLGRAPQARGATLPLVVLALLGADKASAVGTLDGEVNLLVDRMLGRDLLDQLRNPAVRPLDDAVEVDDIVLGHQVPAWLDNVDDHALTCLSIDAARQLSLSPAPTVEKGVPADVEVTAVGVELTEDERAPERQHHLLALFLAINAARRHPLDPDGELRVRRLMDPV